MRKDALCRSWFAVTALVAATGLVTQAIVATEGSPAPFWSVVNTFSYFTTTSNLLVVCASVAVACGKARGRGFSVLWLVAFVGIVVTAIVFQVALAGLHPLRGLAVFENALVHQMTPAFFVLGWLAVGPRGALTWRTVAWSLAYPLAWIAVTLPRGAASGFYPYPFVDAGTLGYGKVAVNCVLIGLFFVALAAGALGYDRHRVKRSRARAVEHALAGRPS